MFINDLTNSLSVRSHSLNRCKPLSSLLNLESMGSLRVSSVVFTVIFLRILAFVLVFVLTYHTSRMCLLFLWVVSGSWLHFCNQL